MPITWRNVAAPQNYAGSQQFGQGVRTVLDAGDRLVKFGQQEQQNNIRRENTAQAEAAERSLLEISALGTEELQQRRELVQNDPAEYQRRYGSNFSQVIGGLDSRESELTGEQRQRAVLDFNAEIMSGNMTLDQKQAMLQDTTALVEKYGFEGANAIQRELGSGIQRLTAENEAEQMRELRLQEANRQSNIVSQLRQGNVSSDQVRADTLARAQGDEQFMEQLLNNFSPSGNLEEAAMNYADQLYRISQNMSEEDSRALSGVQAVNTRNLEMFDERQKGEMRLVEQQLSMPTYGATFAQSGTNPTMLSQASSSFTSAYSEEFGNENAARNAVTRVLDTYRRLNGGQAAPEALVRRVMDSATVKESGWFRNGSINTESLNEAMSRELAIYEQELSNFQQLEQYRLGQVRDRQDFVNQNDARVSEALAMRQQNGGSLTDYINPGDLINDIQFAQQRNESLELQRRQEQAESGRLSLQEFEEEVQSGLFADRDDLTEQDFFNMREATIENDLSLIQQALTQQGPTPSVQSQIDLLERTLAGDADTTTKNRIASMRQELELASQRETNTLAGASRQNEARGFFTGMSTGFSNMSNNLDLSVPLDETNTRGQNVLSVLGGGVGQLAGTVAFPFRQTRSEIDRGISTIVEYFSALPPQQQAALETRFNEDRLLGNTNLSFEEWLEQERNR